MGNENQDRVREQEAIDAEYSNVPAAPQAQGYDGALVNLPSAKEVVAQIEKKAEIEKQIRHVVMGQLLYESDFLDLGGKPYLTVEGAERLKGFLGLEIRDKKFSPDAATVFKKIREGEPITVLCTATVHSKVHGLTEEVFGTRSSDDKFFGGQAEKLGRIEPGHVLKAAESNMVVNAVTRIMGLRGMTWDEVHKQCGHSQDGARGRVDYRKHGQGNNQGGQQGQQKYPPTTNQINYLKGLAQKALGEEQGSAAVEAIKDRLSGKDASELIKELKNGNKDTLEELFAQVRAEDQQRAEGPPPDDDAPPHTDEDVR